MGYQICFMRFGLLARKHEVFVVGNRFAEVPGALQQKLTLGFCVEMEALSVNPATLSWARVNNHKLTLSFTPVTEADDQALAALIPDNAQTVDDLPTSILSLIEVVPELKLDGEVIHTGTAPKNLGEELMLFNQVFFPGRGNATRPLSVIVGSYLAIGSESGSISSANLEALRQKIEQTKATLETEDPGLIGALDREDILGDLFHAGSKPALCAIRSSRGIARCCRWSGT